ncbi:nucleotidyltransferase domain-containing protein [Methylomagnum sp.]
MTDRPAVQAAYRHLFAALAEPARLLDLREPDWDALLPLARSMRLWSRLAASALDQGLMERLSLRIARQMEAALRFAAHRQQKILWELHHLERALRDVPVPVLALKGTGYVMGGLVAGRGRIFNDVDLLVPRSGLAEVESVLKAGGWRSEILDDYDERYYREWMHEIPPMRHPDRQIEADIHHTISPLTSQLKVDAGPLFEAAIELPGHRFKTLAPADMVLHSAIHLFYGGEFEHGLRDLSDLDCLMREFSGRDPEFWTKLVSRAESMHLGRPLFYALRYGQRLLNTPVPAAALDQAERLGPGRFPAKAMDALMEAALMPNDPAAPRGFGARARELLWIRSHWLKMPPGLLLPHLIRKAGKGKKPHG